MEALNAVSSWNSPAPIDRVDKRFRKTLLKARTDAKPLIEKFFSKLEFNFEDDIVLGLFQLAKNYEIDLDRSKVEAFVRNTGNSAISRVAGFKMLDSDNDFSDELALVSDIEAFDLRNEIETFVVADDPPKIAMNIRETLKNPLASLQNKQIAIRRQNCDSKPSKRFVLVTTRIYFNPWTNEA